MKKYEYYVKKGNPQGVVGSVYYSIARVKGLGGVRFNDIVAFESGGYGQVTSLSEKWVSVILLDNINIHAGEKCASTSDKLRVPATSTLLGMTIDPLGNPLRGSFGKGRYKKRLVDSKPPKISTRKLIKKQLKTGIKIIDLMLPLAYGQRQLVIGNRKTGKTPFLLQTAKSIVKEGGICVYGAIGKKMIDIALLEENFKKNGILDKSVIIASSASEAPGMVYLSAYTAMAVAEYFRDEGAQVLLILDEMTTHAKYYRELTLLSGRFPGRESYPGDIFFAHSRIMERAGNFKVNDGKDEKEASITCLPVASMVMGDISGYIQTNLMAMTDGHIYFDTNRYNKGVFPAINPFLSVTRVGRQTQGRLLKDSGNEITRFLVRVEELEQFAHFGAELSAATRKDIDTGHKLQELLQQNMEEYIVIEAFLIVVAILYSGIWKDVSVEKTKEEAEKIMDSYKNNDVFRLRVDDLIRNSSTFGGLVYEIEKDPGLYREYLGSTGDK